ncbi:MAG: DUF3604 domain-containing protein [Verrucomicrobia bacterium]|jgi:hypothetical protein|nr:DUF3604 domain-containing protein [Verrucomicrobiota bacterium]MBT7698762.1 DUF3604 domain-containing protein [Verrucomicrobiota bacterium]
MNSDTITVIHPEPLTEKCLRLEARGGAFARAMMTIPTVVKPGEPFAATVSLLDENAMPIVAQDEVLVLGIEHAGEQAHLQSKGASCSPLSPRARQVAPDGSSVLKVTFPAGRSAVCRVEGLSQPAAGYFRLQGEIGGQTFVSNPALATDEERPLLLWGDPHIHTTVGDCHAERCRTRNVAYAAARHAYGLDFVAIADHVSWAPRGTAGKWYDNLAACELYDEPGVFSTLYCYETSMKGGRGGDCNIYLRQPNRTYVDPWPDDLNIAGLCEQVEGDFFAVPHHTTRTGKHGEIPPEAYPDEKLMPVAEIHSKWGTSEYRGNPTPLAEIHPGPSYVQDLLAQGYRFGFIGGTDSHTSLTFCLPLESEIHRSQPGMTAVMVAANNRNAIYDAIQARSCYAACGERILLDVTCGGLAMGQAGPLPDAGDITIRAEYAAESEIESVEVIRNGEVVHRESPNAWKGALEWTDRAVTEATPISDFTSGAPCVYYYVRITAQSNARAWSSPCWFSLVNVDVSTG